MLRFILAVALCFSALAQAQQQKRSSQEVWNDLFAKREGVEHRFNKFLAETVKERKPGRRSTSAWGRVAIRCFCRRSDGT